jgi:hypothetical protein
MRGSGPDEPAAGAEGRRCPACGALVSEDARWCGQCFRSLVEPEPEPEPQPVREPQAGTAATTASAPAATPTWPCPTCGNDNPIELDICVVCGTSFASLMRQDEVAVEIDPREAVKWSLIYPGLGHRKAGRGLDGLARGVLFTIVFALAILTGLSGVSTPAGLGIFLMYVVASIVVYVGTAYEASHIAGGGQPFIAARTLLWITVGLILTSVALVGSLVVLRA